MESQRMFMDSFSASSMETNGIYCGNLLRLAVECGE